MVYQQTVHSSKVLSIIHGKGEGEEIGKMVKSGQKWLTIQIRHIPNAHEAKKNPGTEPKTCEKGPKLGFEYLPTSKTSHCVRTACMAFPDAHPSYCGNQSQMDFKLVALQG